MIFINLIPFLKITRSLKLSTLLSTSFEFIRSRLLEGKYIDDFPEFHGIGEDFKQFAQSKKATWVKQLNSNPESGPQMETVDEEEEEEKNK